MDSKSFDTTDKDHFNRRVSAVCAAYSSYSALTEHGVELVDDQTSLQIFCPFHDNKNTAAARFYASSGSDKSHFYCFKCKLNLNSVGLYAKFNNIKFGEALSRLERRFGIKIEKQKSDANIEYTDRDDGYKSAAWNDIPRYLLICEKKLARVKPKASFVEYVQICRVLDHVSFDFDKVGHSTPDMKIILDKINSKMDDMESRLDELP